MPAPELHPDLEPWRALLGTWAGPGQGSYPTIEPFGYLEEVTFGHVGKPFLAYGQKTRHATTNLPLHAESGYWRPVDGGRTVELVLAQPSGIIEVQAGTFDGTVFDLRSTTVLGTPTAKPVTAVHRRFELAEGGEVLRYELSMAAMGLEMTHHLQAELRRQPAG